MHIESGFWDIGYMDTLSRQDTLVHRLDPRTKLLTTLLFITVVVSFGRFELSALVPFVLYPVFLCSIGSIPITYLLKKIALVAPFAIMIGIFNPLLDTTPLFNVAGYPVSGGWVSFFSILLRFGLTVGAALSLIAVTGFHSVCLAMEKLGVPRVFTVQLMFLHRYLFVLTAEASRMVRASALRRPDGKGLGIKIFSSLLGHLLLRTLDRAQRIHLAMHCRGFDGQIRTIGKLQIGSSDILFFLIWAGLFLLLRWFNLPQLAGQLAITFI
jgi:cobalt/nickel transport system permease protein